MYCFYSNEDVLKLFECYHSDAIGQSSGLVDFFGVLIPVECAPYLSERVGVKINTPPYPDDSIRAGFIEYLAVLDSIRYASSGSYQMAEIGASYGPFTAICALLALRNFPDRHVTVRPVEAARNGDIAIGKNLAANGLFPNKQVDLEIFSAAVSSRTDTLFFPDVDCTLDNGAMASRDSEDIDVRGMSIPHIEVKAIPLDEVISSFRADQPIDLVHIDIQGAERYVLPDAMGVLNMRLKRIMIATHSRLIEGELMDVFHRNGWTLIAEDPVGFNYQSHLPNFIGMTVHDGSQYWVNNRFKN